MVDTALTDYQCEHCQIFVVFFIRRGNSINSLSPTGDENEISLYIINTCSNIEVMRIKKMITRDEKA